MARSFRAAAQRGPLPTWIPDRGRPRAHFRRQGPGRRRRDRAARGGGNRSISSAAAAASGRRRLGKGRP